MRADGKAIAGGTAGRRKAPALARLLVPAALSIVTLLAWTAPDVEAAGKANAPIPFRLFPPASPWNQDVSAAPVAADSRQILSRIGLDTNLHPDFGTVWNGAPNGIQYVLVGARQPRVPISFYYGAESDPGPYPIPPNPPIEGGASSDGDRHVLVLDTARRLLYEVYDARYDRAKKRWRAGSGAVWDLNALAVRPDGWTSADAAGLPMLPGLVRYDEVKRGRITHALRVTVPRTRRACVWPATHFASDLTAPDLPPMGARIRLRATYDISRFPREVRVILIALKKYGMIVADNGGPLYISGAPNARWNDAALHALQQVTAAELEVVDGRALEPAAPVVYAGRQARVRSGASLRRWGCFADPRGSRWSATAQYGEGGMPRALKLTRDKRFRLVHRYSRAGRYRVTVRVTDARGATGSFSFRVVVGKR